MQNIAQQLFFGLLIETIAAILYFKFKDDRQRIAILILFIGTIIAGLVAFWPLPEDPLPPQPTPTLTASAIPEPSPEPNSTPTSSTVPELSQDPSSTSTDWKRSFVYEFSPGFWSTGSHEYTIDILCANFLDGYRDTTTKAFVVTTDIDLYPGDIYLRPGGLNTGVVEGEWINEIHHAQPTIGIVTFQEMSLVLAESIVQDCNLTISWDGEAPQVLVPQDPYQVEEGN